MVCVDTIKFAKLSLQFESLDNKAYKNVLSPISYSFPPILLEVVALSMCPVALFLHADEEWNVVPWVQQ